MLALLYLAAAVYIGDGICRRFYRFLSAPHRWATAVTVGLLLASWFTYLAGLAFWRTARPLLWADLLFFLTAAGAIFWFRRRPVEVRGITPRAAGSSVWDWVALAFLFAFVCCLLVGTLQAHEGRIRISGMEYGDFAATSAIAQSFALGHNFPTEYPHYAGQPNHYHFLFYFQAGNLEFLGLNLAWSIDALSVLGLTSMLALVMTLGELLFNSRAVGRIGAALFFFHGSPMFISFLRPQTSLQGAIQAIRHLNNFLPSGYPYRGETWGIWSQIVFVNQRHLPSAIAVLLVVLIFLVDQFRQVESRDKPAVDAQVNGDLPGKSFVPNLVRRARDKIEFSPSFVFSGFLLGALPLWHTVVFTAAGGILLVVLVLFPCRWYLVQLGITAAVIALPQLVFLRSGEMAPSQHSLLHWGFIVDNPTLLKVINYILFTFGLKWPLILIALVLGSWFQRRFFIALLSVFLITFGTQLSVEALANHKFLNIWLVTVNLFVAYGLCRLWLLKTPPIVGPALAVVLTSSMVLGGAIDLFPIYNSSRAELDYKKDPLVNWVLSNTRPKDVFLSNRFVNHEILLAGRKVFFGWPYYTWSAGYDLAKREPLYKQMFESKSLTRVFGLLKQNNIAYVAYDDGVRRGELIRKPNEQLYSRYFPKVFEDNNNRYGQLNIYKVPDSLPPGAEAEEAAEPAATAFEGGKGSGKGQFDNPRGLAIDARGNILVADTNNGRIQKFSATGVFITSIGSKGTGYGQFREPNSVAVDKSGNLYVTEASNQRVQKLAPDGAFTAEWHAPEPGFYGPRKIAIGPDESLYVVDQGRDRIVRFDREGHVIATWGKKGNGDAEFDDVTSVAVDPIDNRVYVADPRNKRIQVFDPNGRFVMKWTVEEWRQLYGLEDLIIDPRRGRLYASSANMDAVLVFDLNGTRIATLKPNPPDRLDGAAALALWNNKLYVLCNFGNRITEINLQ